jgi:protein AroM
MRFPLPNGQHCVLRPASSKDVGAIIETMDQVAAEEVYLASERARWSRRDLLEMIRDMTFYPFILIAEVDARVIGHAFLQRGTLKKNHHTTGIGMLIIQAYRGMGIGTRMLDYIEGWARRHCIRKLFLSVFETNGRAVHLYQKMGFVMEGIRPDQFLIRGEYVAEIVMGKMLNETNPANKIKTMNKGGNVMKAKIGLLTIGQSPRTDLTRDLYPILGSHVEIVEYGALDELSLEEIQAMAPLSGEPFQVTILRDGKEVHLKKPPLLPLLQKGVTRLNEQGAKAIIVWCTGDFPDFISQVPVIKPDPIMRNVVSAIIPKGELGILCPSPEQSPQIRAKWESMGYNVHVEGYSPFHPAEDLAQVVGRITAHPIDMMVLDCMGMKTNMKHKVQELTDKPVILPLSLIARVVTELI